MNGFWSHAVSGVISARWTLVRSGYPDMHSTFSPGRRAVSRRANSGPLICGITTSVINRWMGPGCSAPSRSASSGDAASRIT